MECRAHNDSEYSKQELIEWARLIPTLDRLEALKLENLPKLDYPFMFLIPNLPHTLVSLTLDKLEGAELKQLVGMHGCMHVGCVCVRKGI